MKFFVHPQGICESDQIGDNTRIWAFAHVLPDARIGRDCNICDHVFIENDVVVGDRVTIKSGVQLWNGVRLGHDVFVGPNATFTNDRFPRSKQYQDETPRTRVEDGASICANATILPGITIGREAMVGAAAVVTHDVPAHAIVFGNPARIHGYSDSTDVERWVRPDSPAPVRGEEPGPRPAWVRTVDLTVVADMRGSLAALEHAELPFVPRRTFVIYDVPDERVRGQHAHRVCHLLLVCLHGSVSVALDDGRDRAEVHLEGPRRGLWIPPMVWATQYRFSQDAVLMVLASHPYDVDDYIRDYEEFLSLVTRN